MTTRTPSWRVGVPVALALLLGSWTCRDGLVFASHPGSTTQVPLSTLDLGGAGGALGTPIAVAVRTDSPGGKPPVTASSAAPEGSGEASASAAPQPAGRPESPETSRHRDPVSRSSRSTPVRLTPADQVARRTVAPQSPEPIPETHEEAVQWLTHDDVAAATLTAFDAVGDEAGRLELEHARAEAERAALIDADAFLDLNLNGMEHGAVLAHVKDGDILILEETLQDLGIDLEGVPRTDLPAGRFIKLSDFGDDVAFALDPGALTVDVTVDPTLLPTQTLDLQNNRPADMEMLTDISAFLNYGVRTVNFNTIDGFSEFGMNVKTARLYTGVSFPWKDTPIRGLTHITYDHLPSKHRFTAGDAFARGDSLGGAAFLGGLQVSKTYELDPYFIPGLTLDQQTQVMLPSTLEVYVNGRLTERTEVQPGPLDIQNLPITTGAGDTRVVLRDALGREQAVSASYYRPQNMLSKGQQEYTYTMGFQRRRIGVESFDYGGIAAMGHHRVGINRWLTTGFRAEGSLDRLSTGVSAVTGSAVGQVELSGAYSTTVRGEHGGAAGINWAYLGRRVGATAFGRYTSDNYTTLTVDPAFDRATAQGGASVSVPIGQRVTVGTSYGVSLMRDAGLTNRASVRASVRLPHAMQLSTFGLWSKRPGNTPDYLANLTLTATFGPRLVAQARGEYGTSGGNAAVELARSRPVNNGVGFRVGGQVGTEDRVWASTHAQGPFFRSDASYQWNPKSGHSGTLGVSGGFVGIGGKVFATRPVEGAYALVRVPNVKGVRAFLNNNEVARTNRKGDAIVLGLLPYYGNRLSISDVDVPLEHSIGDDERVVAPAVRSGAVVAFPVQTLRLVRGQVTVQGEVSPYGGLVVEVGAEKFFSPLGSTGAFELEGLPAGTWTAVAEVAEGTCSFSIDVPPDADTITNLGPIDCPLLALGSTP